MPTQEFEHNRNVMYALAKERYDRLREENVTGLLNGIHKSVDLILKSITEEEIETFEFREFSDIEYALYFSRNLTALASPYVSQRLKKFLTELGCTSISIGQISGSIVMTDSKLQVSLCDKASDEYTDQEVVTRILFKMGNIFLDEDTNDYLDTVEAARLANRSR